jgi:hypothetical protein
MNNRFRHLSLFVSLLSIGALLLASSPAIAADKDYDTFCVLNDCSFYNPYGCGPGDFTPLVGNDNIEKAYNYFVAKGLQPYQSAGIVGNLIQESNVNPNSDNPAASGGGGGIAQWEGGRWNGENGLLNFAEERDRPWNDLGVQLDFIWHEMPGQHAGDVAALQAVLPGATGATSALEAVSTSPDFTVAAVAFELTYERAGTPVMENRIEYAGQVVARYGGGVAGASDAGDICGSGIVIGNYSFPLAPQRKRGYSNVPLTDCRHVTDTPPGDGDRIYTTNGIYTDNDGKASPVTTCHHDATPAFDLSYGGVDGQPIYAITDGEIGWVSVSDHGGDGTPCQNINFHANIPTDHTWYWYGHILAAVTGGQTVKAGDQIGVVAPRSYGAKCWQGGPHLHIDRGCTGPNGTTPKPGGGKGCRDPAFTQDLQAIWEALPEE